MSDQPTEDAAYPWDEISPEEEALTAQWGEIFRQAILSLTMARGESFRKTSSRAGYSSAYLTRIKTGGRNLTLKTILRLLASFRMPLALFLRRVMELIPRDDAFDSDGTLLGSPADLLCEWREAKVDPPEPFLEDALEWFGRLELRELSPAAAEVSVRPTVLVLEEQRTRDWRSAKAQLEVMAKFDLFPLLEMPRISRGAVADFAVLLAAWSATQRVAGLRGHAVSGLSCALRLAQRSKDVWAQGFCLQKAAYLAHDLGRDIEALAFVRMAALCFSEDGNDDDHARITVDRAHFAYYCGRYDEAERLFRSGLVRLGTRLRPFRLAAFQGISAVERKRGKIGEAIDWLEQAARICEGRSLDLAHIRWTQAHLYKATSCTEAAIAACQEAIAVFGDKGQAGDVALVAVFLAELYLAAAKKQELVSLAENLTRWISPLAENSVVRVAVENLIALLRMGQINSKNLQEARLTLGKAGFLVAER